MTALTPVQERALQGFLATGTVTGASEASGRSERQCRRYLQDPTFQGAMVEARREGSRKTAAVLSAAGTEAVSVLVEIARDGESEAARVSAARALLDHARAFAEADDLAQRIESLEAATAWH